MIMPDWLRFYNLADDELFVEAFDKTKKQHYYCDKEIFKVV